MDIQILNAIFPTLKSLYQHVGRKRKIVLPDFKSTAITTKYLFGVMDGTIYSITQDEYKVCIIPTRLKMKKSQIVKKIENFVKVPLGFDGKHSPNMRWLVDVLYTKDPNDEIFTGISIPIERSIPKDLVPNDMVFLPQKFSRARGVYRRTQQEKEEIDSRKLEKNLESLQEEVIELEKKLACKKSDMNKAIMLKKNQENKTEDMDVENSEKLAITKK